MENTSKLTPQGGGTLLRNFQNNLEYNNYLLFALKCSIGIKGR